MTALPNPFLSASDGLHPLSSVAVTPLAPPALGATAEISSAEPLSAGPAVVAGLSPGSVTTAGTNSAEYKYLGNFAACEPWAAQGMSCDDCMVSWTGCWDNFQCPKCGNGELPNNAEAASDCINEIFTFARGLMRDYQPDFQALLNEIAPFQMEYLPDYRLGDDDQPLFLQGAVA